MNKIDEALVALNAIFYRAQEDGYDDEDVRGYIETIRKALTAAKEREPLRNAEQLKREYKQKIYDGNRELRADTVVWMQHTCETVINTLVHEGHLTSSEKPTHSIQAAKGGGE